MSEEEELKVGDRIEIQDCPTWNGQKGVITRDVSHLVASPRKYYLSVCRFNHN